MYELFSLTLYKLIGPHPLENENFSYWCIFVPVIKWVNLSLIIEPNLSGLLYTSPSPLWDQKLLYEKYQFKDL